MQPPAITKGFIVDTVTGQSLRFQFNPNELTVTRAPNWASVTVPGMSHDKMQFINGGPRKFSFELEFFGTGEDVANRLRWLESLTYPDFNGTTNLTRGAHPCLFTFGQLYRNIRCVVTSYSGTPHYLFNPQSLLPYKAKVSLELTQLIEQSVSSASIRGGA